MIDVVTPDIRIREGREFFNIAPSKTYEILELCAGQYDDARVIVYDEELLAELKFRHSNPKGKQAPRAERLTFEMIDTPVTTELNYYPDESIIVTAVDKNNMVRIDDIELSLSAAARYIDEKLGTVNKSRAYQGAIWFTYDGETLNAIRKKTGL